MTRAIFHMFPIWKQLHRSTAVYASLEEMEAIHGHEGRTTIVWIDND